MLDTLKAIVKMPRIIQLNKRYKRILDEQYVSYDSWIRQKELEYMAGTLPNTSDIQVIEYAQIGVEKPVADVVLYVANRHKLSDRALHAVISVFNEYPETKIVYGDEDEYNSDKTIRMNPLYRPDWSPDTLMSYFYMGNVVAIRKECIPQNPSDIYDLVCKATGVDDVYSNDIMTSAEVRHIDYVLYHNDYSKTLFMGDNRYLPVYKGNELISIVIPSKDNPDILKQLLTSMTRLTTGVICEVIIIDNGSNDKNQIMIKEMIKDFKSDAISEVKYIYRPQAFNFSKICNQGAEVAKGQYLLFLNDDIEIRDSKWLQKMMSYATLKHVGAVGAKLYYPESKMIQHIGITNLRLGPVHKLQYKEDDHIYYDHVNDVNRDVIGVTGACLLVRKEVFDEVSGFDEELRVAFNDVDLCFKIYEAGYHNVVVNTTHLWHYESLSRGDDESREKLERLQSERTRLYKKHPDLYGEDPYYHDYLTGDILDSNYTCAYEYEYDESQTGRNHTLAVVPKKIGYKLKPEWYNECLIISLEQCGSLEYWLGPKAATPEDSEKIYIGGYAFVAGSDNSCFDFKILLKNENQIYEIPTNQLYRPDLEINLDPEENAVLCGFSLRPDVTNLPSGEYQVGVIARGLAARLVLCRFTNRYIKI